MKCRAQEGSRFGPAASFWMQTDIVSSPTGGETFLMEALASLVELEKRLSEESEDGRLLAANIRDNPICTVNFDARIPGIVVVWKRYATSLQLRFAHEKL